MGSINDLNSNLINAKNIKLIYFTYPTLTDKICMALAREGELWKDNNLFYDSYSPTYAIRFVAQEDNTHRTEIYPKI